MTLVWLGFGALHLLGLGCRTNRFRAGPQINRVEVVLVRDHAASRLILTSSRIWLSGSNGVNHALGRERFVVSR